LKRAVFKSLYYPEGIVKRLESRSGIFGP